MKCGPGEEQRTRSEHALSSVCVMYDCASVQWVKHTEDQQMKSLFVQLCACKLVEKAHWCLVCPLIRAF